MHGNESANYGVFDRRENLMKINNRSDFFVLFKQFFKFCLVGVSNTLIGLAVYYLALWIGLHYILAHVFGFFVSVTNAYYWNSKYVFIKTKKSSLSLYLKTVCSYGLTFLLGLLFMYLMVDVWHISEWIAPILNLPMTIPLNFILNKFWAFK